MHTAENVSHRNLLANASAETDFVLNSHSQCLNLQLAGQEFRINSSLGLLLQCKFLKSQKEQETYYCLIVDISVYFGLG